jgi:hypothetical protein
MVAASVGSTVMARNWNVFAITKIKIPGDGEIFLYITSSSSVLPLPFLGDRFSTKKLLVGNCMVFASGDQPRVDVPAEVFMAEADDFSVGSNVKRLDSEEMTTLLPSDKVYRKDEIQGKALIFRSDPRLCEAERNIPDINDDWNEKGIRMIKDGVVLLDNGCTAYYRDANDEPGHRAFQRPFPFFVETGLRDMLAFEGDDPKMLRAREETIEMQLWDTIAFQVDRHDENYFVDVLTGKVTGIDLDMAWSNINFDFSKFKEVTGFLSRDPGKIKVLPPVISERLHALFSSLSADHLKRMVLQVLGDEDLAQMAVLRLEAVQNHLKILKGTSKIVPAFTDEVWGLVNRDTSLLYDALTETQRQLQCLREQGCARQKIPPFLILQLL